MYGKGSLFIMGKIKSNERFRRLGSNGLVTNVIHCVFWPPSERWKAERVIEILQKDNPGGVFKIEETR